jgi:NADH dehydrogenase
MTDRSLHAVTGAFGYSGRYIAQKLLAEGYQVITLTNSLSRANEFADQIKAFPFKFDQPAALARTLEGVDVLYNTYWVRFNHPLFTHAAAIQNMRTLFEAAQKAGVKRIVHISITNPSEDSKLEYFRGKAILEHILIESGLSYAILRPAVLFGKEDILINNIAWVLRHFPVYGVFGDGMYKLQPIYIEDLADLALEWGLRDENKIIDAIGPETFTYRELVQTIGQLIEVRRPILSVPPLMGYWIGSLIGFFMKDVMITRQEIEGLMANLLYVDSPPAGKTRLTDWIKTHADTLGQHYTSELRRRKDRIGAYQSN